jgi:ABC-type phosphate transport system ATPase subunit
VWVWFGSPTPEPCSLQKRSSAVSGSNITVKTWSMTGASISTASPSRPSGSRASGAARTPGTRALTRDPGALLLDEPTAALDREAAAPVEALVRSLAGRGLAILIVTHDDAQAQRVANARIEVA